MPCMTGMTFEEKNTKWTGCFFVVVVSLLFSSGTKWEIDTAAYNIYAYPVIRLNYVSVLKSVVSMVSVVVVLTIYL